jgi:methyl-accepting chemotaxis protein
MRRGLEMKIVGLVVITFIIGAFIIGFLGITFVKRDIRSIVDLYTGSTLDFITYAIEETMATGNAEVTKDLIRKKGSTSKLNSIMVFNTEGKVAFSDINKKIQPEETHIFENIRNTHKTFSREGEDSIVYYTPLMNKKRCMGCHNKKSGLLGMLRVSMQVKDARDRIVYRTRLIVIGLLFTIIIFSLGLWLFFKRTVISPIKTLEDASKILSNGDLSFRTNIKTQDEIGQLNNHLKASVQSLKTIIQRAKGVSGRVRKVVRVIENESKIVVEGTQVESDAADNIFSSIEELDTSIGDIDGNLEVVSSSTEEVTVAVDEMVANAEEINQNTNELSGSVDASSSSIEEMSISIQEIAERTKELDISAEETLGAIEEIGIAVKEIDHNTHESAKLSEQVTSDASSFGMERINQTSEGMKRIKTTVQKTADFIERLGGRSEEIGKILGVIEEITDQTTLLALNAAILAAQAGEHGKGFSVVAEEIKGLAERTAFSTQEISSLIKSVQFDVRGAVNAMAEGIKNVEAGVALSGDAKEALQKIIESSKKSSAMAHSIKNSTAEQTKGVKFVTEAMERVKDMIRQISKATSEQVGGMNQIISTSEQIKDITKQVRNANIEQSRGGKQIYQALENTTMKVHTISKALKEQKSESGNIVNSLLKIKDLPAKNKEKTYAINNSLRGLQSDSELLMKEMDKFKIEDVRERTDIIKFGVVPLESPAEMYNRFIPLTDYLSKKMNKKVELFVAMDFAEAINSIGEGITNISYLTPTTYIAAKDKFNIQVIAKALNEGKPYHYSVIVARDGGNINTLEDIRGRSFAFGDKNSTSSYLVPLAMLQEAGIQLKDLDISVHLGHHDDVARAVVYGEFDAGGLMASVAEKFKNKRLKIISTSIKIPEFNICVNQNVPETEKQLIKQFLLELNDKSAEHREIIHSINPRYTGFVESVDSDYDDIRKIMEKIKLQ